MTLVDAHAHLWDRASFRYDWLEGEPHLPFAFLPDDLAATGADIDQAVFLQADCAPEQAVAEAQWVDAFRQDGASIAGIVAFAPLERAERESVLDELSGIAGVVGVRRLLQDEPADMFDSAELAAGIGSLAARGWTFDACVRAWQLPHLERLARQVPDVPVVLDHLGKPAVADMSSFDAWLADVRALAALPHVSVKLSGMTPAARPPPHTAHGCVRRSTHSASSGA